MDKLPNETEAFFRWLLIQIGETTEDENQETESVDNDCGK